MQRLMSCVERQGVLIGVLTHRRGTRKQSSLRWVGVCVLPSAWQLFAAESSGDVAAG